ncbi:MAG: nitroreductase family protein [Candidatus Eremiobacteraeota bacterium]|nr:nitroreductase family protein [Candidatus Eremiobacteraeota bacterium]MCW5870969.1 nitroreductase family protein [Candidatus Eremiobacteraeota bacterium]
MSLYNLLNRRRMVREYEDRPLERDKLERVLAAALRGPSAGNSQGVSLVVVQTLENRQAIAALAGEPDWLARGYPAWLSLAPVHLILCAEPQVYRDRYAQPDKDTAEKNWPVPYWHVDAGCMLMILLLAALEEGLAAGFQGIHNLPGLADLLHIPAEVEPIGLLTLGYSQSSRKGHSANRPARAQRVHLERW